VDGIFPALLHEGREILIPHLIKIFRTCLATGYVPTAWRRVKVVFFLSPVGVPTVDLRIFDPLVSHRSY